MVWVKSMKTLKKTTIKNQQHQQKKKQKPRKPWIAGLEVDSQKQGKLGLELGSCEFDHQNQEDVGIYPAKIQILKYQN